MPSILRISEAASIALHAAASLAESTDRMVSMQELASTLKVSANHLEKVLQRLAKAGVVEGFRGPKGGYRLSRPAESTTLLDVYEAIEGKMALHGCLLGNRACKPEECILGGLAASVNQQVTEYFSRTTLDSLARNIDSITIKVNQ